MNGGAIRVLLVEDNPDDALLIQQGLAGTRGRYFQLERVERLAQGLERLAQGNVDVVLLDLALPDSQGVATFLQVNEAVPQVPVILLTGTDDEQLAIQAAQQGAQDYLVKGQVDDNLLSRSIFYAIERCRLKLEAEQHILENAELKNAILQERNRLARDLHDSVTQSIYSLTLWAEAGRRMANTGNYALVEEYLGQVGETGQQALKEMRLLVYELRPLELQTLGLVGALQQRLEAVEQRGGVEVSLTVEGEVDLPESLEVELHWVVQESLNNVLKHARATQVTVLVDSKPGEIKLEVVDNGVGFDTQESNPTRGIGLDSMRERIELLGGNFAVDSQPDRGTHVKVAVPLGNRG